MDYKGEDMDLRTPQSYGAILGREPFEATPNGTAPHTNGAAPPPNVRATIWVDDVLLACCNHAYDVAFAHRAAEVRIEHLLYAITRVDAATEVLEANGVRDAGLRRESAMVIASGLPVGTAGAQGGPRGSAAYEEALRLASAHAGQYNRAAGIPDLLHVFTFIRPDLQGLDLLRRHLVASPVPRQEPQPPPRPQPTRPVQQAYSPPVSQPATQTSPKMTTQTDIVQDKRLAALEQMVRAIGLERDYGAQAHVAPTGHQEPLLPTFAQQPRPPVYNPPVMAQPAPMPAPVPPTNTFDDRNLDQTDPGLVALLEQVSQRLATLDGRLNTIEAYVGQSSTQDSSKVVERIDALEDLLKSNVAATSTIDLGPLDTRLNDIEVALLSQDSSTGTPANLEENFDDLRENFAHSIDNMRHILNERIDKLHENTSAQFAAVHSELTRENTAFEEANAALGAELKAIAGANATHAASSERNLNSVREAVAKAQSVDDDSNAEVLEAVNTVAVRLAKVESDNHANRSEFVEELKEVHDAIMKLNDNQHTMAESITNWHHDHLREISSLGLGIARIDTAVSKPRDEIANLSADVSKLSGSMDSMYRATIQRYHRRNRFWFWMFGTDDWVGASWPSQTARIESELRVMKTMREDNDDVAVVDVRAAKD